MLKVFRSGWFALLLLHSSVLHAGGGTFDDANRLYEQGRYRDAVEAYGRLASSGSNSVAVWFNLGNALFKAGQVGDAIAAYRRAERLAPRDPDVGANLEFARRQVKAPTLRPDWLHRQMQSLTTNEWTILAVLPVWICFLLLTAAQLKPAWKLALRRWTWLSGTAGLVACGALALVLQHRVHERIVVVNSRDTALRAGPFDESPSAFTASDGAEFTLVDAKDDWYQVSDGTKPLGWLKTNSVTAIR
jgi:tetratricopeptide (TPR) repeat protein